MKGIILLSALVAVSSAIVCPPSACKNVKQPDLNCKGSVLKGVGFCGCTNACAKVEGESCKMPVLFLGMPSTERCDNGLKCKQINLEGFVKNLCVNETKLAENGGVLMSRKKRLIVCTKDMCDSVKKPALNCAGGVIKKGGFCGCTDICAKVEGEACQIDIPGIMGFPNTHKCDKNLVCAGVKDANGKRSAKCIKASKSSSDNLLLS